MTVLTKFKILFGSLKVQISFGKCVQELRFSRPYPNDFSLWHSQDNLPDDIHRQNDPCPGLIVPFVMDTL